ncbi:MAG: ISAzo13 family transposase [bacterium]
MLDEKNKRLYVAIEAIKVGRGGISYIADVVDCNRKTIARGIRELQSLTDEDEKRVRAPGGGRKSYDEIHENINAQFLDVLKNYTAGDPMNEEIKWTNLTHAEIAETLKEKHDVSGSDPDESGRQLLLKHNYRTRKAQKNQTAKSVKNRNEQFENIDGHKENYMDTGNPILSMDTKKKEYIGNFYRDGALYTQEVIKTHDHDFNSLADGVVIPHGIYDIKKNTAYINIDTSKDTSEFACPALRGGIGGTTRGNSITRTQPRS